MATTIHIPPDVLERVDLEARARGLSRNRFVLEALEAALAESAAWPEDLVRMVGTPAPAAVARLSGELDRIVSEGRRSKREPPEL